MWTKFVLLLSFVSSAAFAHDGQVPEFFYQSEDGQTTVQGELGFGINNQEIGANETDVDQTFLRGWVNYGLTENFAIQFGIPFAFNVNQEINGTTTVDGDSGFSDFELNLLVHRKLSSFLLFYGVEGAITLDKTGTGPNFFSTSHSFNPYLGISKGEENRYGAKFTYRTIGTTGDVLGNFDYDVEFFGEWDKEDRYLLGAAVGYLQTSGADDSVALDLYGRVYFEKFTLVPRITYTHSLDSDIDSQLNLVARLGVRTHF